MSPAGRREGLFRGTEFPRMVLLLGVALVGWVIFWMFASRAHRPPARPKLAAEVPPLPPPDKSPAFEGIRDKTPVGLLDRAAYAELWRRANETPPAQLAREARHDVRFSQVFDDPARYRGLPIHVEGLVRRILVHDDADPQVVPGRKMYEAYVFSADSQNNPYVLAFKDPPRGLPIGDRLEERIRFDGYFLKQMLYHGGDGKMRFAPLLIGRLNYNAEAAAADEQPGASSLYLTLAPIALLAVYIFVRGVLFLRRMVAPTPSRPIRREPLPTDEIDPDRLAAWVESADEDEPEFDVGRPGD